LKHSDNQKFLSKKSNNKVRIIGGKLRGRNLNFSDTEGLRPTGNRIKETLFNWLTPYIIVGSNCLDLFAGSGSLGVESVSRGALSVTMVEKNHSAFAVLKRNCSCLNMENITIVEADALKWLTEKNDSKPFDVVFLDPPFDSNLLTACCSLLAANDLLAKKSYIYIETDQSRLAPITPTDWRLLKEKTSGQVAYKLYYRDEDYKLKHMSI
jgi:16S rRNA (guanine966-N2)-methyltransferase|tara:strand:+ start:11609 stop:12238 length:630 start_codon:yes stop_codon:yes gene_type:complete